MLRVVLSNIRVRKSTNTTAMPARARCVIRPDETARAS